MNFVKAYDDIEQLGLKKYDGSLRIDDYMESTISKIIQVIGEFPLHITKPDYDSNRWHTKIFRVRPLKDIKCEHLRTEYSYPPIIHANTLRANLKNYPVFYGSDQPGTSIIEYYQNYSDLNLDEKFCLSIWSIRPNTRIRVSPFIFSSLRKENPYNGISELMLKELPAKFQAVYSDEESLKKKDILEFYSEAFVRDESHVLSSILAHRYLYANHNLRTDILIYPSVQTDRMAVNFAIQPNFVDESMVLEKVYVLSAKDIVLKNGLPDCDLRFFNYGENVDNIIYWKGFDLDNPEFRKMVETDFQNRINMDNIITNKHSH
jgi:hypothetical protein